MRTVLVVEDEALIALDLVCAIEAMGYRAVGPAANGAEARKIAAQEMPDLLLMDVTLHGQPDGIDTARSITEERPAKVIFLTAMTDEDTRRRAEPLNPEAFLSKPYSMRQMEKVLEQAFAH